MNELSGLGSDLLGTLAVGVGAAAFLYALGHSLRRAGRPLPRWVLPAGIGLAMIAYATWNEYSWASRVKAQLPAGIVVIAEGRAPSMLRPWTYLAAPVTRMMLVDPAAIRPAGPPGAQIVPVTLVQRWKRSATVEHGVNCLTGETRQPGGEWHPAGAADFVYSASCGEGRG